MSHVTTSVPDPNSGWECPQCRQTRFPNIVHMCPTAVLPGQVHYQQKDILIADAFIPKKKYDIAVKALQAIIQYYGKVCDKFELCRHVGCHCSCDSWLTAHSALEELGEKKPDSEPYHNEHVCHWHYVEIPVARLSTKKARLGVCCICEGDDCDDCGKTGNGKDYGENNQS